MTRRHRRRGPLVAGLAGLALATLLTPSAEAATAISGRTCCDPGGASARGNVSYSSRYSVSVTSLRLNDICPGDGDSVYVEFQYDQTGRGWTTRGRRENHGGCEADGSTGQAEDAFTFTASSGRIQAVRLKVCVDETFPNADDCAYSNTVGNPYG